MSFIVFLSALQQLDLHQARQGHADRTEEVAPGLQLAGPEVLKDLNV
jgi:hypothetical protein